MKFGTFSLSFVVGYAKGSIRNKRKHYPSRTEYRSFLDVPYLDDKNKHHTYDVYLADESNRKHCCFIDIHGGSYVFGDHYDNYPYAYVLLKAGYDVVLVDYKPNNGRKDISDLVNDCALNITHLAENLEKYGLLGDKFIMTGDSAGGHLSLLLSLAMQDKEAAKKMNVSLPELPLIGTVIACPVYNYANIGDGALLNNALRRMKGPKYKDKKHLNIYSPNNYISHNKLPLLVTTCKYDFLREESLNLNKDMEGKEGYIFIDLNSHNKRVDHVHNVIKPNMKESVFINNKVVEFTDNLLKE